MFIFDHSSMDKGAVESSYQVVDRFSHDAWEVLVRSDQIVQVNLSGVVYGRPEIESVIGKIRELSQPSTMLVLVISHPQSRITVDGIRKLFSRESTSYPVAKAYVISRPVHFTLAKWCLRIYKPKTPIRIFADKNEAERWLLSLVSC